MTFTCPSCNRIIAKQNEKWLKPLNNAELVLRAKEAPRVKCKCGKSMIFLRGKVGF